MKMNAIKPHEELLAGRVHLDYLLASGVCLWKGA